jgi:hypothetical protein
MSKQSDDFAPIVTVTQSTNANEAWVVVTLTRENPDGSTTQTTAIEAKPR